MDHIALDRAGAHDRDLDHQVVEAFGLDPRQHRHLGAAFDLEDAQGIGLLDHYIDRRIIVLQVGNADRNPRMLAKQFDRHLTGAEHVESEHLDIHGLADVDNVFITFYNCALYSYSETTS